MKDRFYKITTFLLCNICFLLGMLIRGDSEIRIHGNKVSLTEKVVDLLCNTNSKQTRYTSLQMYKSTNFPFGKKYVHTLTFFYQQKPPLAIEVDLIEKSNYYKISAFTIKKSDIKFKRLRNNLFRFYNLPTITRTNRYGRKILNNDTLYKYLFVTNNLQYWRSSDRLMNNTSDTMFRTNK